MDIDLYKLQESIRGFNFPVTIYQTNTNDFPFLNGLDGHYHILKDKECHLTPE